MTFITIQLALSAALIKHFIFSYRYNICYSQDKTVFSRNKGINRINLSEPSSQLNFESPAYNKTVRNNSLNVLLYLLHLYKTFATFLSKYLILNVNIVKSFNVYNCCIYHLRCIRLISNKTTEKRRTERRIGDENND